VGTLPSEDNGDAMQPIRSPACGEDVNDSEIYRKHKDDLVRFAASLVGSDGAEDVVSAVVLRTLARRSLSSLEEPRAYLFRAVLNQARSTAGRRTPPARVFETPHSPPPSEPRPEVIAAVMGLPLRQRAATYLVYWADLSIAEAARLMGARPGTVKRYLHLARRSLKGVLDGR